MIAPLEEKALAEARTSFEMENSLERAIRAYLAASPSPSEKEVVADRATTCKPGLQVQTVAWLGTNLDGESEPFLAQHQAEFWSNGASNIEPLVTLSSAQSALSAMAAERDRWEQRFFKMDGNFDRAVARAEAAEAQALRLTEENEALRKERDHWKANHAEMVQRNAVLRERPDLPADRLPSISRYEARIKALEEALRADWHGVYLDGRNEHGSHVIRLPQRAIELEQDEEGDFLKPDAETILSDAEALGFVVGDAVVATFTLCTDDGFFSHYEYAGISSELTEMLYGSHTDQARSALKENAL